MAHTLSSRDYELLLETIEIAHSIPERTVMIHAVFEKLEKWIGFSGAVFLPTEPETGRLLGRGNMARWVEDNVMDLFCSYYASLHPAYQKGIPFVVCNRATRLSDTFPTSLLPDTEYGRDFQPLTSCFYELGQTVVHQGNRIAQMPLLRKKSDRDFSTRHVAIMNRLLPHLAQALHNITLTEAIADAQDVGVIVVGPDRDQVYINDIAKRALNGRPVRMIPDPGLGPGPAFFRSEKGAYRVLTRSAHGADRKAIFLDPLPSQDRLWRRLTAFNLTPRQGDVALMAMRGFSNREIAEKFFITEQTVKDHLRNIFEKMEIHRRGELVAKLLGIDRQR
jgi:DNA-binding CsgD family transcriptional regulator